MDAAQAIGEMTEISPQVHDVAVAGGDGSLVGSNVPEERARQLADGARALLQAAEPLQAGVAQLEAATAAGSVFVVREGERLIVATTTPEPTVGLVFYDLKTCLRSIDEQQPKERRRRAQEEEEGDAAS